MNMKYRETPKYEEVDVVAKTMEATCGTIDRKPVGRALLTEQAGFAGKTHEIVDGDGVSLRTVKPFGGENDDVKEVEAFVELVGGKRSLASYKFYKGWLGANPENQGVTDVFVDGAATATADMTNHDQVEALVATAARMCNAAPECDGRWQIVDKDGKRLFLREVVTKLTSTGMVERGTVERC